MFLVLRMIVRYIQSKICQWDGERFSFLSLAHRISLLRIQWGEGGRRPDEVFPGSGEGGAAKRNRVRE
jgi:hypothetical protein